MKRLIAFIAICALPFAAQASPQLAQEWGGKAASLHAETMALITDIDSGLQPEINLAYLIELERFTATAKRLGSWIDDSHGSAELSCIFRTIAAEGARQTETLDTVNVLFEKRRALRRLARMFSEAEMIAGASSQRRLSVAQTAKRTCPADPPMVLSSLN